jgi:hypothetical protein
MVYGDPAGPLTVVRKIRVSPLVIYRVRVDLPSMEFRDAFTSFVQIITLPPVPLLTIVVFMKKTMLPVPDEEASDNRTWEMTGAGNPWQYAGIITIRATVRTRASTSARYRWYCGNSIISQKGIIP